MTTWKNTERREAKLFGGKRLGATGQKNPDVVSDRFAIEVKHRAALPEWIKKAVDKACEYADKTGLIPLVLLHEHGKHDDYIIIRRKDFFKLIEEVSKDDEESGHSSHAGADSGDDGYSRSHSVRPN